MAVQLETSWKTLLADQFDAPYFKQMKKILLEEMKHYTIYPPKKEIFAALDACPVEKVKVVILGQDPYHNPGQAHGLCFSVKEGVSIPKSLQNIYRELNSDLNLSIPNHGNLSHWSREGVLLLNSILTVRAFQAGSHEKIGWHIFTDTLISRLSLVKENLVFLLWGNHAISKKNLIDKSRGHLILEAPHPSPLSAYRGFFGCKHFSKTNEFLRSKGISEISWEN